jgi:hypothetical protein
LKYIQKDPQNSITLDGGPHTLWWPTQGADGVLRPDDIPPAQLIREIQPQAKFLITLANPIHRMYSDYYFLNDDRKVAKHGPKPKSKGSMRGSYSSEKSPAQFHERVIQQVSTFHQCLEDILDTSVLYRSLSSSYPSPPSSSATWKNDSTIVDQPSLVVRKYFPFLTNITNQLSNFVTTSSRSQPLPSFHVAPEIIREWFRASQVCAHDRHKFGVAGYGRLGIGLYVLFIEKWLEHFDPSQFLIVRLENYEQNPREYMSQIFTFLNVSLPSDDPTAGSGGVWDKILTDHIANRHSYEREEMSPETEVILRDFYRPYNQFLALLLQNRDYLWEEDEGRRVERKEAKIDAAQIQQQAEVHKPDDEFNQESTPKEEGPKGHLRGKAASNPETTPDTVLISPIPQSFSLENLPSPLSDTMNDFVGSVVTIPIQESLTAGDAFEMLCSAILGMDLVGLKYLLYEYGIPTNLKDPSTEGSGASPFHCLSAVGMFGDANSKSQVFPLLKGQRTWLTDLLDPPLPTIQSSVHSMDIKQSLSHAINSTFQWLVAARADVNATDLNGQTPLHTAAAYGLETLVELYLLHGANPNALNKQQKTPLHYSIALGYSRIGSLLVAYGADLTLRDIHQVTPLEIISSSGGVISASDALKYFSIVQPTVRVIDRLLHPHYRGNDGTSNGGYRSDRLSGYEEDLSCEVDQYLAHEISAKKLFEEYFARNRPVLIRGLIDSWPVIEKYKLDRLESEHGADVVQVSPIPYSTKFGGEGVKNMPLSEYIQMMRSHNLTGGSHPWYVFKGHPIRTVANAKSSLVAAADVLTPKLIAESFHYINMGPGYRKSASVTSTEMTSLISTRKDFINAQWALGGAGTGAPVHFHNTAWSRNSSPLSLSLFHSLPISLSLSLSSTSLCLYLHSLSLPPLSSSLLGTPWCMGLRNGSSTHRAI